VILWTKHPTLRSAAVLAGCVIVLLCLMTSQSFAADAENDSTTADTGGGLLDLMGRIAQGDTMTVLPDSLIAALTADQPYLTTWDRTISSLMNSGIRTTRVGSGFDNNLDFRGGGSLDQSFDVTREDYRSQEKVVDKRDTTINYRTNQQSKFRAGVSLMQNWSEDEMTTSSGLTTLNKRNYRKANATMRRDSLSFVGAQHSVSVVAGMEDQQGEQQNQRNDFSESNLAGAIGSSWQPASWIDVNTRAYTMTESGERSLGKQTNPSSSSGDSLKFRVNYDKGSSIGHFSVRQSNFDKRYLDYRRNSNGIIDTIGVTQKVIEELERNDALTIEWSNDYHLGPLHLKTKLAQDVTENAFRESGVGTKERQQDTFDVDFGMKLSSRDTLSISYGSMKKWDDQIYRNATLARGKQTNHHRDVALNWKHDLFENTDLKLLLSTGLTQDIAENGFNKNDRDRLDSSMNVSTGTLWGGKSGVKVDLSFDIHRVEDISIRKERSGNNSIKESYELTPSYLWPVASWLDVNQSFRVWIQYTDYVFSDLETVNKEDDFNKRGNLDTRITIKPNSRLTVTISHNYNIKLNGKKSETDAAGRNFYFRESDQTINKINASMSWKVTQWLELDGTTYKSHDLTSRFGNTTTETERFSGELGLGGKLHKKFSASRTVSAGIRKFFAHGPNVQKAGQDYWDIDVAASWRF
jgi:hypothetical protein